MKSTIILILLLTSAVCMAADLEKLKSTYEKTVAEILYEESDKTTKLDSNYRKSLETIQKSMQQAGDLEKLRAAINELNRFKKEKNIPDSPPADQIAEITKIQEAYNKQKVILNTTKAKRIIALMTNYDKYLEKTQKDLTRAGKLDDATAVLTERSSLKKKPEVISAQAVLSDSKPKEEAKTIAKEETAAAAPKPEPISSASSGGKRSVPDDAKEFKGHYYKMFEDRRIAWEDAKSKCEEMGGYLAVITSEEENEFVAQLLEQGNMCWLGGIRTGSNKWMWITKEFFKYSAWGSDKPSPDEEAVRLMMIKGKWRATKKDPGRYNQVYACEWSGK